MSDFKKKLLCTWFTIIIFSIMALCNSYADANTKAPQTIIEAEVVKIIDGDTIKVKMFILPYQTYICNIRAIDIDTAETRGSCDVEKELASRASNFVKTLIKPTDIVWIENPRLGKYSGRLLGDIKIKSTKYTGSLSELLIKQGFAIEYHGGTKYDWCND